MTFQGLPVFGTGFRFVTSIGTHKLGFWHITAKRATCPLKGRDVFNALWRNHEGIVLLHKTGIISFLAILLEDLGIKTIFINDRNIKKYPLWGTDNV